MAGPLAGLKVIDLTSNFMGPYASLLLADMGADVCKVEPPEGDTVRWVGLARTPGMSALFLHLNRNKRSIVLDLKTVDGQAAIARMLASADVLLYSLRPQAMARLQLDYDTVRAINPRLIYCGAFGFGQEGPYAARPAYDNLIQAAVGVPMAQARKTNGPPTYVATAIVDRSVGIATSNAILAALYHRAQSGLGQSVSVPMFETFAHLVMGDHLYGETFVPPLGEWGYARMTDPERQPYPTADGYLSAEIVTDRQWQRVFAAIGRPELASDPRYGDLYSRGQRVGELYDLLRGVFRTRPTAEWIEILVEADIPAMPVNTPRTLLDDPHLRAVGFFSEEEHPSEGRVRSIGLPHGWSQTPVAQRYPTPRLGEQTLEVLRDYGFSEAETRGLLASGAARVAPPLVQS